MNWLCGMCDLERRRAACQKAEYQAHAFLGSALQGRHARADEIEEGFRSGEPEQYHGDGKLKGEADRDGPEPRAAFERRPIL